MTKSRSRTRREPATETASAPAENTDREAGRAQRDAQGSARPKRVRRARAVQAEGVSEAAGAAGAVGSDEAASEVAEQAAATATTSGTRRPVRPPRQKAGLSTLPLSREQSAERLVDVMGEQLGALCTVIERVGDSGTDADLVLAHLAALASRPKRPARKGQERAWLLAALLRLLGASATEPDPRRLPMLRKVKAAPGTIEVRPERLQRLADALQGISPPERATVVLVVQECLTFEQASRVLGHSRREFVEAYHEALAALDAELLETLMGH